ncbi:zinc-ribbon domain-containing protein [Anaeromassilibacillus sp. 1001302B_160321_C8]|uniref:zinc-ribbon domain-containing protein n=1 Tax=Anaeromassilibacillus sp. 1001302B_160321_C8 TaxID=2787132 RepID=UPI0018992EA5|nr:zinc-ribbon domain-containing protein [Anaeromassilibacillus sp. 1001302B_160321_C8]
MYCIQCGKQIDDGSAFCPECGSKQEAEIQTVTHEAINSQPFISPSSSSMANTNWANSYFDGGLMGLIGVNLAVAFVSFITLGLAWPALWCFRMRWVYKHTVIGGYRLKFTGKGGQLFGKYLLWVLLTIVTLTIYAWWLPIKYKKWEISHVEIDSMIPNNRY